MVGDVGRAQGAQNHGSEHGWNCRVQASSRRRASFDAAQIFTMSLHGAVVDVLLEVAVPGVGLGAATASAMEVAHTTPTSK
eukprot:12265927-Prorocentrum_lima.AAC.1